MLNFLLTFSFPLVLLCGFGLFLPKSVESLELDSPRFLSKDGNLVIRPAWNRNVTLETHGETSYINVGTQDLVHIVHMAENAAITVQNLHKDFFLDETKNVRSLASMLNGPTGLWQRVAVLEANRGLRNNTGFPRITYVRRLSQLRVRVLAVERKLNRLKTQLETDSCVSSPCQNGGTCQNQFDGFTCQCPPQWEGPKCLTDVNECQRYFGTDLGCQNGATCINSIGSYLCECPTGWFGLHCTRRSYDCTSGSSEVCGHGTCIPQNNAHGIKCLCDQGWTTEPNRPACTLDVDECLGNNHPCSVTPFVSCVNTPGSFRCGHCPAGYSGNGYYCVDIDECADNNGGCSIAPSVQCTNTLGSRVCGPCPPGYSGDGAQCNFVGLCNINNGGCHPNAVCSSNPMISSTYVQCICQPGFTGSGFGHTGCRPLQAGETNIVISSPSHCTPNPCQHGTCHHVTYGVGYVCICEPKYTGQDCSILVDPCSSKPCENQGVCTPNMVTFTYTCECTAYYTGSRCQTPVSSCGGTRSQPSGSIVFPESEIASNYQPDSICAWVISTEPDKVLNITFTKFNMETSDDCLKNYVQLHDGRNTAGASLGRFCGSNIPNSIMTSHNHIYIAFSANEFHSGDGFTLHWSSETPVCGGQINVNSHGYITSPGYPGKYPPNRDCYWYIEAPEKNRLEFHFLTLQLEDTNQECRKDYVEISDSTSELTSLAKYCNTSHPAPLMSLGSKITVHFYSDGSTENFGFQLSFSVKEGIPGCGGLYNNDRGEITSPLMDGSYMHNVKCNYKIQLPPGNTIRLKFLEFDLEDSSTCNFDYIAIYDGSDQDSKIMGRFCGNVLPPPLESSGNEVLIKFRTDFAIAGKGFRIHYELLCHYDLSEGDRGFTSPGYPTSYPGDRVCTYLISFPLGKAIKMSFDDFAIEGHSYPLCTYDSLMIYDGDNENSTLIGKFCGGFNPPAEIISTHNFLFLKFTTDNTISGTGFKATYSSIDIGCGGILKDKIGYIDYPNTNEAYADNALCRWVLKAPYGYIIHISWSRFNMESSQSCSNDYLQIFDNDTISNTYSNLGKFCGTTMPPSFVSTNNVLTFVFESDYSIGSDGFSLRYFFSDQKKVCGGTYLSASGSFASPGWPDVYPTSKDCVWKIIVPNGQQISLNITTFDLEQAYSDKCVNVDYLEIRNGGFESAPLIGKYCGNQIPSIIPSLTNSLYIHFFSDIGSVAKGFYITWDSLSTGCGGVLTSYRGTIISPNYPQPYGHSAECYWRISTSAGSLIQMVFADLDLELDKACRYDYVEMFDGIDGERGSLGRFCSFDLSHQLHVTSKSNHVYVKFRSDSQIGGHGFKINYNSVCNQTITGYNGAIESLNFPSNYPDNVNCLWKVTVPSGNKINVTVSHFDLEKTKSRWIDASVPTYILQYIYVSKEVSNDTCLYDYLQISDGEDGTSANKYCGDDKPPPFYSTDNEVYIHFFTDQLKSASGFRLEWTLNGCGGYLTKPEGSFTSPGYPKSYPYSTECQWTIIVEQDKSVELTLEKFDLEITMLCSFDALHIFNGPSEDSPRLAKLCHSTNSSQIFTSSGNVMLLKFVTDSSVNGRGFTARYRSLQSKCGGKLQSISGFVSSPNYPNNYGNNLECMWYIEVPKSHRVVLKFEDFDTVKFGDVNCTDFLNLYDGDSIVNTTQIAHLCGDAPVGNVHYSSSNKMLLEFRTDNELGSKGFLANYSMSCGSTIVTDGEGVIEMDSIYIVLFWQTNCTWTIFGKRPDQRVALTITHMFIFQEDDTVNCTYSSIQIYNGASIDAPLIGTYCGSRVPPTIVSTGNAITIFRNESTHIGRFSVHYSVMDSACGGTLTAEEGSFASPMYPESYPASVDCVWKLTTSPGNRVMITFSKFNVLPSESCNEDYLEIREGDADGKLLDVYCGDNIPTNVTSGTSLWVKFHSNEEGTDSGFICDFAYVHGNEFVDLDHGTIASPLYPLSFQQPGIYYWRIMVKIEGMILITFQDGLFDRHTVIDQSDCEDYNSITIYDGYDATTPVLVEACGMGIPEPVRTTSNVAYIKYHLSGMESYFLLNWIRISKDDATDEQKTNGSCNTGNVIQVDPASTTIISSPGFPDGYAENLHCEWILETPSSHHLGIKFDTLLIEESDGCYIDKVTLFKGSKGSEDWVPLGDPFCLRNASLIPLIEGTNLMKIVFETDGHRNESGFSAPVYSFCGGDMRESSGIIKPTNAGRFSFYRAYIKTVICEWNVTVKAGRKIVVEFLSLNISATDPVLCSKRYVLLRNGASEGSPFLGNGKYCGTTIPESLVTSGNKLHISYTGLHRVDEIPFVLRYSEQRQDCGSNIVLSKYYNSTEIMTPNYPNIPHPNSECSWMIMAPAGERLSLDFIDRFDLTVDPNCAQEYVEVYDGGTELSRLIGRYCISKPRTIKSTGNAMFIMFATSIAHPRNGFKAKISIDVCGGTIYHSWRGKIQSPNIMSFSIRPGDLYCEWRLIAPTSDVYKLNIDSLNMPESEDCGDGYLEILDVINAEDKTILSLTDKVCKYNNSMEVTSSSHEVLIRMALKKSMISRDVNFQVSFNSNHQVCNERFSTPSGFLIAPTSKERIVTCTWKITVAEGRRIKLEVLEGRTFSSTSIWIFNDFFHKQRLLFNLTDTMIESSGNTMMVQIWSRSEVRSFKAKYTSDEPALCTESLNQEQGIIRPPPVYPLSFYCDYKYESTNTSGAANQGTLVLTFKDVIAGDETNDKTDCRFSGSSITVSTIESSLFKQICSNNIGPITVVAPLHATKVKIARRKVPFNFTLEYKVNYNCGGSIVLTEDTDLLNLPTNVTGPVDCLWVLDVPSGRSVQISTTGTTFASPSCDSESLRVSYRLSIARLCSGRLEWGRNWETVHLPQLFFTYHADSYSPQTSLKIRARIQETGCGGQLINQKVFSSPNYPNSYGANQECSWKILAPRGFRIKLKFRDRFFLEGSSNCTKDFLEIFDFVHEEQQSRGRLCGRNVPNSISSTSHMMEVLFRTDASTNGDGFKAQWSTFCGGELSVDYKVRWLHSPGEPYYHRNLTCVYKFVAPQGKHIALNFESFVLEKGTGGLCQNDNLTLEGSDMFFGMSTERDVYCGAKSPGFKRYQGDVTMTFKTDMWIQREGFKVSYVIDDCGEEISTHKQIHSPRGPDGKYHSNMRCIWNITAPPDKKIVLRFRSLVTEQSSNCMFDYVAAFNGVAQEDSNPVLKVCGNLTASPPVVESTSNKMTVIFKSDGNNEYNGFVLDIVFSKKDCGGTINVDGTRDFNVMGDSSYESFMDCQWTVTAAKDHYISLTASTFHIASCFGVNQTAEAKNNCTCDYIEFRDGPGFHSPLIGRHCGHSLPPTIVSSTNIMWIRFVTDGTASSSGMKSQISAFASQCGPSILNTTREVKVLTSPGYGQGVPTANEIRCKWILRKEEVNAFFHVIIEEMDIAPEDPSTHHCLNDTLEISDRTVYDRQNDDTQIIAGSSTYMDYFHYQESLHFTLCGSTYPKDFYSSESNDISIMYVAAPSSVAYKGFKIHYTLSLCNITLIREHGRLINSNRPETGNCTLYISAPKNTTIALYFFRFLSSNANCDIEYLEILDGSDPGSTVLQKICSWEEPNPVFSTGNNVTLRSVHLKPNEYSFVSYDITYTSTDKGRGCGGSLIAYKGSISSPLYPQPYRQNNECIWEIRTPSRTAVKVVFEAFQFGLPATCVDNHVKLINSDGRVATTFCPGDNPANFRSSDNYLKIVQTTTVSNGGPGWKLKFLALSEDSAGMQ